MGPQVTHLQLLGGSQKERLSSQWLIVGVKKSHCTVNGVFKHRAVVHANTSVGSDSDDGIVSETADHIKRCGRPLSCQHTAATYTRPTGLI